MSEYNRMGSVFRHSITWVYILGLLILGYIVYKNVSEGFQDSPGDSPGDSSEDSPQYYTIESPSYDGFGSQYHSILSGIAYSAAKGYTYVHSPMKSVAHTHDGVKVDEMNTFMGISTSPMASDVENKITEIQSKEVHFSDTPSEYYTPEVIQKIREYYYSSPKPAIERNDIAIHVRRGDVNKENSGTLEKDKHGVEFSRFTSNEEYKQMIAALKSEYPTYKITIHSQGNLEDFSDLMGENITCKLNEDLRQTFHTFVTAKVFVMGKSSLSYAAAILNEGTVYYQEFWHKPLDNWKNAPTE